MKYHATIMARKVGAIGQMGAVVRGYTIECDSEDRSDLNQAAIDRAYKDGDIEHVFVSRVIALPNEEASQ